MNTVPYNFKYILSSGIVYLWIILSNTIIDFWLSSYKSHNKYTQKKGISNIHNQNRISVRLFGL